ncbi:MAG: FAD-dependent thymidylate synthase [Bacteroidales bacterium]|nr:FAD-dependent thymidylate synthase [Bacteroidales bacterium]
MKILKPQIEIIDELDSEELLKKIELCGRVCYKSEDQITKESAIKFVKKLIDRGHESVLEHFSFSVRFIVDRGVSHELVRHRIARIMSFSQESTRYCNYSKDKFDGQISVIDIATGFKYDLKNTTDRAKYIVWNRAMEFAEMSYNMMIELGAAPEEARTVLPISTKTEVIMTTNIRDWRAFLDLRTSHYVHPQMREVTTLLLNKLKNKIPVLFDDIK